MPPTITHHGSPGLSRHTASNSAPTGGQPSIDPRLNARRQAVMQAQGRQRIRRLAAAAVLFSIMLIGFGVTRTAMLDVDAVAVRGADRTPIDVVQATSGIRPGAPMTDVNLGKARRQIAALPWVAEVTVSRQWPATIEIVVAEREAVAAVASTAGGWLLVDAGGHLLELQAEPGSGVVAINGMSVDGVPGGELAEAARDLLTVAAAVPDDVVGKVVNTAVSPEGELQLGLVDGAVVRVGDAGDLEAKMVAVETIIANVDLTCLAVVDVRVATAPVLTRNRNCG